MIFFILALGLILRVISINQSLWLDEATTALVTKMSIPDIFGRFLPGDFHPPLYYLIMKFWVIFFGSSEISLRIPSVIFGLLTIYIVYKIVLLITDYQSSFTARIAALLLATSGLAVYYSQEARMYSLAALLITLAVYLFMSRRWLLFSITLAAVGMTDYVALLIIPVFWIIGWNNRNKLAACHLPLVVVFAAWFPVFIRQFKGGLAQAGNAWWNILGTTGFKNIALIPVKFMLGRISFDNKVIYALVVLVSSLIFGYLLFRSISLIRKISNLRLIWYWLIIPIALGIVISFKVPTLSYFRFLFCLPALYALVALSISKSGKYKNLFLVAVVSINLLSTGYYLLDNRFHREDWRAAAKAVGDSQIVLPGDSQKEALIYYGKGDSITKNPTGTTIWLSRYVWEIADPGDSTRLEIEQLGYNKAGEYNFNGVVLWKYTKTLYAYKQSLPPRKEGI